MPRWSMALAGLMVALVTSWPPSALGSIGGSPLAPPRLWAGEGNKQSVLFGYSVASAGDVNGDGYDDVIVGAPWYGHGELYEGRALVYHGSAGGPSATENWAAEGDQSDALFGHSVASAGDVNGDGYDDVIVAAVQYDQGEPNEGKTFLYLGSPAGLSQTADWTAQGDRPFAQFGSSVGTAGDVNGDGYDDVIVGARTFDHGQNDEGRAFVYYGSPTGPSTAPGWIVESDQAQAALGASVGTAGDVNGDGYDDVIVGALTYDNGQTNEGRAFAYYGSPSGLSTVPDWTAETDQNASYLGQSVGTAGDVNGDGYADVIVGAFKYSNGQHQRYEGAAFVYHGSPGGLNASPSWTAEGNQADARFGWSVGTAGDINGDGYSDVAVGATWFDNGQIDEGRSFVYIGSASGLGTGSKWTAESNQASAYLGMSVGTAGDVNGDGYQDVIVGAYNYHHPEESEGVAFVYAGQAG